jgi:hypothetical protein
MRQLTLKEATYLRNLAYGQVGNRPAEDDLTAEGLLALRTTLDNEVKALTAKLPENWRELAIAHELNQGVTQYVTPGVAGGVKAPKPKPDGNGVKIDDVDALLMLVGDGSDQIPED